MASTTLTEKLAHGVRRGEYCGAETALAFSDARTEFAALRSTCAVYDLGWRTKFLVGGRDRVRWLNGMISNNVRDLAAGRGVYNFVLNPQGHILGDLYVYNRGEYFVLDTDAAQSQKLYAHLKRFIIMDQVEFKPAEQLTAIGVQGPQSEDVLRSAGLELTALEPLQIAELKWHDAELTLVRGDEPGTTNYEVWLSHADQAALLWDALLKAGAVPVGAEALELARIAAGVPRYAQDIRERDLPQETEQMRALSFTKGCYIGQEIVERIRARGKVHRGFTGLRIVQGPLPAPGTKIQVSGKDVGEITSAAVLPAQNGDVPVALGYLRHEAGGRGTSIEIGSSRAVVHALPFADV